MTNDNDLLLLASSQNNKTFEVYIDSSGTKTLTLQTSNYTAKYHKPTVYYRSIDGTVSGLLVDKNPKKVVFPNCSKITGDSGSTYSNAGAFQDAFTNCTSLTSVSFPSLTTATGGSGGEYSKGAFDYAFTNCTSLTSVSFPSLTTATGGSGGKNNYGAFDSAFAGCTSLASVSFPALTTVNAYTDDERNTFYDAFRRCSPSLKVHFKKSMKGTSGLDRITMGLTSADQIVFDLD